MRKIRKKRIKSVEEQEKRYQDKIVNEKGRKDTTKDYWRKEIDRSFLRQIKEDEEYLEEKWKYK